MKAKKLLVTLMVMAMSVSCIACSDKDTSNGIAKSMLGIEADSSSDEGKTSDETSEKDENNQESSGMEEEVIEDSSEVNDESDNTSENNGDLTSEDNWKPVDIKDVETLFAYAPVGDFDESIIEILFAACEISHEEMVKYKGFDVLTYDFSDEKEIEEGNINVEKVCSNHGLRVETNDQDKKRTVKDISYRIREEENNDQIIDEIILVFSYDDEADAQIVYDELLNTMSQSEGELHTEGNNFARLKRKSQSGEKDDVLVVRTREGFDAGWELSLDIIRNIEY